MRMSKANLKLNELLRETFSRICFWEAEAERAKRPESQYITTLGWKGMVTRPSFCTSLSERVISQPGAVKAVGGGRDGLQAPGAGGL